VDQGLVLICPTNIPGHFAWRVERDSLFFR